MEPSRMSGEIPSSYFETYQLFSPDSYEDNSVLVLKMKRQCIGMQFWNQKIVANTIKCLGHVSEDSSKDLFIIYFFQIFLSSVGNNNKWQSFFENNIAILIKMIGKLFADLSTIFLDRPLRKKKHLMSLLLRMQTIFSLDLICLTKAE